MQNVCIGGSLTSLTSLIAGLAGELPCSLDPFFDAQAGMGIDHLPRAVDLP